MWPADWGSTLITGMPQSDSTSPLRTTPDNLPSISVSMLYSSGDPRLLLAMRSAPPSWKAPEEAALGSTREFKKAKWYTNGAALVWLLDPAKPAMIKWWMAVGVRSRNKKWQIGLVPTGWPGATPRYEDEDFLLGEVQGGNDDQGSNTKVARIIFGFAGGVFASRTGQVKVKVEAFENVRQSSGVRTSTLTPAGSQGNTRNSAGSLLHTLDEFVKTFPPVPLGDCALPQGPASDVAPASGSAASRPAVRDDAAPPAQEQAAPPEAAAGGGGQAPATAVDPRLAPPDVAGDASDAIADAAEAAGEATSVVPPIALPPQAVPEASQPAPGSPGAGVVPRGVRILMPGGHVESAATCWRGVDEEGSIDLAKSYPSLEGALYDLWSGGVAFGNRAWCLRKSALQHFLHGILDGGGKYVLRKSGKCIGGRQTALGVEVDYRYALLRLETILSGEPDASVEAVSIVAGQITEHIPLTHKGAYKIGHLLARAIEMSALVPDEIERCLLGDDAPDPAQLMEQRSQQVNSQSNVSKRSGQRRSTPTPPQDDDGGSGDSDEDSEDDEDDEDDVVCGGGGSLGGGAAVPPESSSFTPIGASRPSSRASPPVVQPKKKRRATADGSEPANPAGGAASDVSTAGDGRAALHRIRPPDMSAIDAASLFFCCFRIAKAADVQDFPAPDKVDGISPGVRTLLEIRAARGIQRLRLKAPPSSVLHASARPSGSLDLMKLIGDVENEIITGLINEDAAASAGVNFSVDPSLPNQKFSTGLDEEKREFAVSADVASSVRNSEAVLAGGVVDDVRRDLRNGVASFPEQARENVCRMLHSNGLVQSIGAPLSHSAPPPRTNHVISLLETAVADMLRSTVETDVAQQRRLSEKMLRLLARFVLRGGDGDLVIRTVLTADREMRGEASRRDTELARLQSGWSLFKTGLEFALSVVYGEVADPGIHAINETLMVRAQSENLPVDKVQAWLSRVFDRRARGLKLYRNGAPRYTIMQAVEDSKGHLSHTSAVQAVSTDVQSQLADALAKATVAAGGGGGGVNRKRGEGAGNGTSQRKRKRGGGGGGDDGGDGGGGSARGGGGGGSGGAGKSKAGRKRKLDLEDKSDGEADDEAKRRRGGGSSAWPDHPEWEPGRFEEAKKICLDKFPKVCTFYLLKSCTRKDCPFKHEVPSDFGKLIKGPYKSG